MPTEECIGFKLKKSKSYPLFSYLNSRLLIFNFFLFYDNYSLQFSRYIEILLELHSKDILYFRSTFQIYLGFKFF